MQENDIILCDGSCRRAYHEKCLDPPLVAAALPEDEGWLCPACDAKVTPACIGLSSPLWVPDALRWRLSPEHLLISIWIRASSTTAAEPTKRSVQQSCLCPCGLLVMRSTATAVDGPMPAL